MMSQYKRNLSEANISLLLKDDYPLTEKISKNSFIKFCDSRDPKHRFSNGLFISDGNWKNTTLLTMITNVCNNEAYCTMDRYLDLDNTDKFKVSVIAEDLMDCMSKAPRDLYDTM